MNTKRFLNFKSFLLLFPEKFIIEDALRIGRKLFTLVFKVKLKKGMSSIRYTVKPRKVEPTKLRTNRLFSRILYPLD